MPCGNPCVGKIPWRREWQSTPVFLPRELRGQRSLAGYSPWHRIEWYTTEWLTLLVHWYPAKNWVRALLVITISPLSKCFCVKFPTIFSVTGVRTLKYMFCFQCTINIFLSSISPLKWTRFLDFLTFHLIFSLFSPSIILHIAVTVVFPDNTYTITRLQI